MTPPQPLHDRDWPALAAAADRLLGDRDRSDPASVEAKRLTPADADARRRVARSLVLIYRAIAQGADIPALPAGDAEIRADLANAAAATARAASARPEDAALAAYAARIAALARHHQPWRDDPAMPPSILFCHRFNRHVRAQREAKAAA